MVLFNKVGQITLSNFHSLGKFFLFLANSTSAIIRPPYRPRLFIGFLDTIGFGSMLIVVLTSAAIGLVMGVQGYLILQAFGITYITGGMVAVSMTRELAPILAGLMVTARAGSAMAAEISSMKVGEQVDALRAMAVSPYSYIIAPRILATTVVMPVLMSIGLVVSLLSSYLLVVVILGVNDYMYRQYVDLLLSFSDYVKGMIKAAVFGFILSSISCYQGYYSRADATGVGIATTNAVIWSSVMILLSDSVLTLILF